MKCMKKDGVVKKFKDENAILKVKEGWVYVAKKEWKKGTTEEEKKAAIPVEEVKVKTVKKPRKRKNEENTELTDKKDVKRRV